MANLGLLRHGKYTLIPRLTLWRRIFFFILAHSVYKM